MRQIMRGGDFAENFFFLRYETEYKISKDGKSIQKLIEGKAVYEVEIKKGNLFIKNWREHFTTEKWDRFEMSDSGLVLRSASGELRIFLTTPKTKYKLSEKSTKVREFSGKRLLREYAIHPESGKMYIREWRELDPDKKFGNTKWSRFKISDGAVFTITENGEKTPISANMQILGLDLD